MSVKYRSTRGKQSGMTFEQVVLGGLATDKGLFVPESIPTMSMGDIEKVTVTAKIKPMIFFFFSFLVCAMTSLFVT